MSGYRANQLVAAGFLIFRRIQGNIEYLLLQTSYGQHHWSPPKGHVDPGESEMETAYRETREEAGLTTDHLILMDGFQKTLKYGVRGKPKRVEYWLSELKDPDTPVVLSHEHTDFKWLSLEKAFELISAYKELQEAITEAEEYIKKHS